MNKGYRIRRLFFTLGLSLISFFSIFPQFQMGNTLAPLKDNEYSIVYSNDMKGGHHQVSSIADRDAIPVLRRQLGMLCTVLDDGTGNHKSYQLIGGLSNSNWTEYLNSTGTGNQQLTYDQVTHILTLDNGGTADLSGLISTDNQLLSYNQLTHLLTLENGGTVDLNLVLSETDPKWTAEAVNYYTKSEMQTSGLSLLNFDNITNKPSSLLDWSITDGISKTHPINSISYDNISQWDVSFNIGNHADLYLNNKLNSGSTFIGDVNNKASVVEISGDATLDNSGVLTINNQAITTDKIMDHQIEGDNIGLANQKKGDLMYFDGTSWVKTQTGTNGQLLIINDGIPAWKDLSTGLGTVNVTSSHPTKNGVTANANVLSDGLAIISERGIVWGTIIDPTVNDNKIISGSGLGQFSETLDGLTELTNYYLRAYVINSSGINYSNSISFIPRDQNTPIDGDGNVYQTVQIGEQLWMAENLKTTKFNDGTPISLVTDDTEWWNTSTPGFCWYDNDEITYKGVYGALYNWYAVNTEKLCPIGWHIPGTWEWHTLISFLDPDAVYNNIESLIAGGKLKEANTIHWETPNNEATNESGFTALPGGIRASTQSPSFVYIGQAGYWWSSTESGETDSWYRSLEYNSGTTFLYYTFKWSGFSVRCLRD